MGKFKYLTKNEKETKYKAEIILGVKLTNDMKIKHRKGKEIPLTRAERSYRTGFINALKK